MNQAIHLLSSNQMHVGARTVPETTNITITDPFTDPHSSVFYSSPEDPYRYPSPSHSPHHRYAWIHVFPEGRIHQHPDLVMRYFKWGVARLILEADPAPTLVPIWIDGFQHVMSEDRRFPRFIPRTGQRISVNFGKGVDTSEGDFAMLRLRWRQLVEFEKERLSREVKVEESELRNRIIEGLLNEHLKFGAEAVRLREECTFRVREEVLGLRKTRGLPDEDPKARKADTWFEEGRNTKRRDGRMEDGSLVKDT